MNSTDNFDYIRRWVGGRRRRFWRRGWRRPGGGYCCSKGRRRPAPALRHQRLSAGRRRAARRLRRAGVPRWPPRTTRCGGTSSCVITRTRRCKSAIRNSPRRPRQSGRRHPLSARRDIGRLHRAQCDDPRLPAQCRLGRDRAIDRRPVVERRSDAQLFRAPRKLPIPPARTRVGEIRPEPVAPRLGWLAAFRKGGAGGGDPAISISGQALLRFGRRGIRRISRQPMGSLIGQAVDKPDPITGASSPRTRSGCGTRRSRPASTSESAPASAPSRSRGHPPGSRSQLNALVTRVILDASNRATGVEY